MMTTLTQCEACGRWIADMARHQPVCPEDRPRPVEQLDPLDAFELVPSGATTASGAVLGRDINAWSSGRANGAALCFRS